MNKKYCCISEYGYIANQRNTDLIDKGCALVNDNTFEELEKFILQNEITTDGPVAAEFLSISYKRGIGKILKAQNYVGLVQTKSGITIEILPKIYDQIGEMSYEKTINIFIRMLKCIKDSPFKKFNLSGLRIARMNLLDIFINMFLNELGILIKRGIKSNYVKDSDNLNFYKGKLNINGNLKNNLAHREKFYVEYDEYSKNRPENRIIKSTLMYLNKQTNNSNIQKYIREFLFTLDEVEISKSIEGDFQKCANDRSMGEYDTVLKWCSIFLGKNSFTNYKGEALGFALLFPMEKIFENYVARHLKVSKSFNEWDIYTQHSKYYLLDEPKMFRLRPDIVMEKSNNVIILDTKWKLLNNDAYNNYGISQGDLYQMFAYAKKYCSDKIILLYPLSKDADKNSVSMKYEDGIQLYVFFIDLEKIEKSIAELRNLINE